MMAYRNITGDIVVSEREELEQELLPLGIVLFENPLKEASKECITQLK
jgi:magnesium-transporting ATPase (P-type)